MGGPNETKFCRFLIIAGPWLRDDGSALECQGIASNFPDCILLIGHYIVPHDWPRFGSAGELGEAGF